MNLSFCIIHRDIQTSSWPALQHCINAHEVVSHTYVPYILYYSGMHKIPKISIANNLYNFCIFSVRFVLWH